MLLFSPASSQTDRKKKLKIYECQTCLVTANLGISLGLVSDTVSDSLDLLRGGIKISHGKNTLQLLARAKGSENSCGMCEHLLIQMTEILNSKISR